MKGNNSMTLNEATMMEIVQEWLEREMVDTVPTVTAVEAVGDKYNRSFIVSLFSDADPAAAKP